MVAIGATIEVLLFFHAGISSLNEPWYWKTVLGLGAVIDSVLGLIVHYWETADKVSKLVSPTH